MARGWDIPTNVRRANACLCITKYNSQTDDRLSAIFSDSDLSNCLLSDGAEGGDPYDDTSSGLETSVSYKWLIKYNIINKENDGF